MSQTPEAKWIADAEQELRLAEVHLIDAQKYLGALDAAQVGQPKLGWLMKLPLTRVRAALHSLPSAPDRGNLELDEPELATAEDPYGNNNRPPLVADGVVSAGFCGVCRTRPCVCNIPAPSERPEVEA